MCVCVCVIFICLFKRAIKFAICRQSRCDSHAAERLMDNELKNWREGMYLACSKGYVNVVRVLIHKGMNDPDVCRVQLGCSRTLNIALRHACKHGQDGIVPFLISKGADDLYSGLTDACKGGHLKIVQFMIFEKGLRATNHLMAVACRNGHNAIARLMFENGADDYKWGMIEACRGGHITIVKTIIRLMMESDSKDEYPIFDYWYSDYFCYACAGGNIDIVDFFICNGANKFDYGLFCACKSGRIHVVKLMIKKGAKIWNNDLTHVITHWDRTNNLRNKCILFMYFLGAHLIRSLKYETVDDDDNKLLLPFLFDYGFKGLSKYNYPRLCKKIAGKKLIHYLLKRDLPNFIIKLIICPYVV